MVETRPYDHADVKYETSGLRLVGVVVALVSIAGAIVLAAIALRWLLQSRESPRDRQMAETYGSYSSPFAPLPSQPRLEQLNAHQGAVASSPFANELNLEHTLHTWGRLPDQPEFVHIPIERAISLTAAKLSADQPSPQELNKKLEKTSGLVGGGEPNSGRLFREVPQW